MKVLSFFTFIEKESKLIELQMMIWKKMLNLIKYERNCKRGV